MHTEALSLRGTIYSEPSSSSSEDGCWDETYRSCHCSHILTGRTASRTGNTDTKQCLLVKTGNRKLAAHGQSQPTDVFCLARLMLKNFFALVASILKLRFHIQFWILRLLLKNLEDVNTGSASHIITRVSWSSEQPLPQAGTQDGVLLVASVLSPEGSCLRTPSLKDEGRSAQWYVGQFLTADSLKKRKISPSCSICQFQSYRSYASGTGIGKGCAQQAVPHSGLTLLGQEACVQRQGILGELLHPQHLCLPGLLAHLTVLSCSLIDFPRITPRVLHTAPSPLLRATGRPTVLHFLWVVGAVWFAVVGDQDCK